MYNDNDSTRLSVDIYAETDLEIEEYRTEFRRDFDRLIHAPSFRRLQGKTQLYPGRESDFFRNRLTHSLEVAQIAKSIAIRINGRYLNKKDQTINLDIVEFAGIAHDLGHPPFGHQGEDALDEIMRNDGGFEGNAQTLRLLTRIEKKNSGTFDKGEDVRVGLNLTSRIIASILKYDTIIPITLEARLALVQNDKSQLKPVKGYYDSEKVLVEAIKTNVLNGLKTTNFKTIECRIMDIADDIAYSTYDLEDGLKASFFNPFDIVFAKKELIQRIASRVSSRIGRKISVDDVIEQLLLVFDECFKLPNLDIADINNQNFFIHYIFHMGVAYDMAKTISKDGYARTDFTSRLVGKFIRGIEFSYNEEFPMLSDVKLNDEIRLQVEILKIFNYESQILSPRLKIAEYRGKEIVKKIFSVLSEDIEGYLLMPQDYINLYCEAKESSKKRIICDFIAGMTDNYCIEFYGRLTSESPETIFKPH